MSVTAPGPLAPDSPTLLERERAQAEARLRTALRQSLAALELRLPFADVLMRALPGPRVSLPPPTPGFSLRPRPGLATAPRPPAAPPASPTARARDTQGTTRTGPSRRAADLPAPAARPDPLRHRTDFLTLPGPAGEPLYSHEYAGLAPAQRAAVREALKARGYTHIYLYVINEGDYGGRTRFNFYEDPAAFRAILEELVRDGLAPVVWLAPDDAPAFHASHPPARLQALWNRFVPTVDDLVSSYTLGLEMDEYWTDAEQDALGRHLRTLTAHPIFVHFSPGRWEGVQRPWASGLIYQYGSGRSEAEIAARTRQLVARLEALDKTFIAGEYAHGTAEAHARRLGRAALLAGAHGFGNGAA